MTFYSILGTKYVLIHAGARQERMEPSDFG